LSFNDDTTSCEFNQPKGLKMIYFIAGAHAVGKSTICNFYANQHDFIHKSASTLISEAKGEGFNLDKKTSTAEENQQLLISKLSEIRESDSNLLLDGHFVLVGNQGELIALKQEVFRDMKLDGVVLIECDDVKIEERFRDRGALLHYSPAALRDAERKNAIEICEALSIPLVILNEPSNKDFSEALKKSF
jgi:adenylate kinase